MKYISFKNLDIKVYKGELVSVIGPNGCGKTIFLRMISGKIKNDYFYIDEKLVNLYSLEYKRNNIVCVFDDNIYNTKCVKEELKYYLNILNLNLDRIDDFNDLSVLKSVMEEKFDSIITFKAICEFVTEQQFETTNP